MLNPFSNVVNSLLPEPQAGLLNGILFGIQTQLPRELYFSLIETGTVHIVVLSGMNISILISLVAKTTLFLGRRTASFLTLLVIAVFVFFVGAEPPVVRASIMGSFSILAIYFGRQYWGLLSLILASMIMLLYDFGLVKNISFQLSFLATLGIILAQRKSECYKGGGLFKQLLYTGKNNFKLTLSAQIFTLPIILYNFGRISLIAPIANLLIEWVIQPIMILGFIASIAGFIWLSLGVIPAWFVWVLLTYLITIVEFLAGIPGSSWQF